MNQIKYRSLLFVAVIANIFFSCKKDPPVAEEFKFPSKVINKIVVDVTGVKWFATAKGVVSYDGAKWTSYSDDKGLTTGMVSDFVFDRLSGIKTLWLGTDVGLSAFEFGTSAISIVNFNAAKTGILADNVSALGIDDRSIKYIGTSKGLSILKVDKWDNFLGRQGEEILANYKITSIAVAQNGSVYAATKGGGVSSFKYADAVSGATTLNLPWANGLQSDTVFTVIVDNDFHQWYGTNKGAAHHSSELTKQDWKSYSRADGLVCDTVYAIANDLSGNIWFGTHKGVSKFTGNNWQNFTTKNGLLANKVNTIAVDVDRSLWFGTDEGISHFTTDGKWVNY
jgi:ligand-binding sensor domain-containing protein